MVKKATIEERENKRLNRARAIIANEIKQEKKIAEKADKLAEEIEEIKKKQEAEGGEVRRGGSSRRRGGSAPAADGEVF